jgi:hypothetical protein
VRVCDGFMDVEGECIEDVRRKGWVGEVWIGGR